MLSSTRSRSRLARSALPIRRPYRQIAATAANRAAAPPDFSGPRTQVMIPEEMDCTDWPSAGQHCDCCPAPPGPPPRPPPPPHVVACARFCWRKQPLPAGTDCSPWPSAAQLCSCCSVHVSPPAPMPTAPLPLSPRPAEHRGALRRTNEDSLIHTRTRTTHNARTPSHCAAEAACTTLDDGGIVPLADELRPCACRGLTGASPEPTQLTSGGQASGQALDSGAPDAIEQYHGAQQRDVRADNSLTKLYPSRFQRRRPQAVRRLRQHLSVRLAVGRYPRWRRRHIPGPQRGGKARTHTAAQHQPRTLSHARYASTTTRGWGPLGMSARCPCSPV